MVTLCNADIDRPLRITIWDWEKNNKQKFMGKVDTSVRGMIMSNGGNINVIEPDKQKKSSYKNSGTLSAGACFIEQNPTFGDVRNTENQHNLISQLIHRNIVYCWRM